MVRLWVVGSRGRMIWGRGWSIWSRGWGIGGRGVHQRGVVD